MSSTEPTTPMPGVADRTRFKPFRERAQPALFTGLIDHLQRLTWDAATLRAFQTERLRQLLAHAIEHSSFHRGRLGGIDPDRFELADREAVAGTRRPSRRRRRGVA